MEDDDIFVEDREVFVSLGLRAEEEAARMNLRHDVVGLNAHGSEITADDYAKNEPQFAIGKENPKIK